MITTQALSAGLLLLRLAGDPPAPATAPQPALKTSGIIEEVTDDPGRVFERNGARWREWQFTSGGQTIPCGPRKVACGEKHIVIANESKAILRCHGVIRYTWPNAYGIPNASRAIIVPAGQSWKIVGSTSPLDFPPTSMESDCSAEPPLPSRPDTVRPECKVRDMKIANPDNFFPQESRDAMHEGPVFVEFSLADTPGPPQEPSVIQTSTYPELDEAALQVMAASSGTTNCPGYHFRVIVKFKININ
ncbi:MAG TPA: energy transducer TonB [Steroidobacteraceae bacterium]|jgi:hypothetical protein|nr:energy transducer TonB [Steroidobacteraceae bacterium]